MIYKVELVERAREALGHIPTNYRKAVFKRMVQLDKDPEKQGKALLGDLAGCRSVHAAGRNRIVYAVNQGKVIVVVIAIGMSKEGDKRDIYLLAKKIFRNFLKEEK